jgi:hypothetical protein
MMEWKTFCCPFHAPENLPNYPQLFSFSATCGTQSIFPQLASALNAYRMDGFDLSLLIISPRFCLVQQKKKWKSLCFYKRGTVSLSHSLWLPFDVGIFVASCSLSDLCSSAIAFISPKIRSFLAFWLLIVYSCAHFPFTLIERG